MKLPMPLKLLDWVDDNREHLKPPVCNKQMFEHGEFIVQVVGGPNSRTDYHVDEGPELFFQVEGEMLLKTVQDEEFVDIPIGEGDLSIAGARAALSATFSRHRWHRRRASTRTERARRVLMVLP
jgi:3-hydroxyanthranilate 3,4-dioxygenase